MSAVTIQQLDNAALDVAHISDVATSTGATSTDRLGNVKRTAKGAVDSIAAFNSRGEWVTGTVYAVKDLVSNGGTWYACVTAHTASAAFTADAAKWRVHQGVMISDLAASSATSGIGHLPSGTGAIADTLKAKLDETVSVFCAMTPAQKADVLAKTYLIDVTASVNVAISIAAVLGKELKVPAGGYLITPATPLLDETGGNNLCAFPMASNMQIRADPGATFKIANNVSTDASPKLMSMFFSNQFLSNISIKGLTMDMNGANNKISPSRASFSFNRFTQAHILFSGTPGGVAAGGSNVHIEECKFLNTAGVTCIGMAQTNSVGITLGSGWKLINNTFSGNGLDTDDHSSVFGWANDVYVTGNTFTNPTMYNNTTKTGGLVCFEIHGSNTKIIGNTFDNYYQGLWISINLTEDSRNIVIAGNKAKVSCCFSDFYSANLGLGAAPDKAVQGVEIYGNTIHITADAVADQVKSFFKVAARRQPTMVNIWGNVCRSFETAKNTTLCSVIVSPGQLEMVDALKVHDNQAAGINVGLVVYFGGAFDCGEIEWKNNSLGNLISSPGGLYVNRDIYLYGPYAGRVQALKLGGLETPASPVGTDSFAGGRATVYGKAKLDLAVTWTGVTIGNGGYSKRIAIDTDTGILSANIGFVAGTTTTYSGNIAPTIAGISADATCTATVTHAKTGAALTLSGLAINTSNSITIYSANGVLFDSAQPDITSYVFVSAAIPCRSANI